MASSGLPPNTTLPDTISVLLVGDSELRRLLSSEPRGDEFLVTEAAKGRDAYQWLTTQPGRVDCIVSSYELPDMNGIGLLDAVRGVDPDLPFILVAADGSEAIASRAISADVTEYIGATDDVSSIDRDDLSERVQQAVTDGRSKRTIRRQARQFDTLLDDPERYLWVLNQDGTVRETNRAVGDAVDESAGAFDGTPFWEFPWWRAADEARERIRSGVQTALEGEISRFDVRASTATQETPALDLAVRPVVGTTGSVERILVDGIDISDRARLEQELRESEELHRVTLNNMTDTVLITDDDGNFTYICPNVHFIFGYTVDEIRDMGSIDTLLGADLFDRDRLEAEGVLTNIETTATDKAGREHTLLVNAREVSIQGGTTLYSCRDITKRKERERALTALHQTSRKLLYAETPQEIARQIADDAIDILDVPGSVVYLFDSDENELQPAAWSDGLERLHGPVGAITPREESIVGHAFVDQSPATYADVHDSSRLLDPTTDTRSAIVIPLGDHGVFAVASGEIDLFDELTEEIADLIAATAEAALDRVERETKLRSRDRELQRQNRQLTRLNRTNEIIRDIDQLLVQADSREEIEHAVCERLTAEDRFEFAWFGTIDDSGTVQPRAWAGSDHGYLDAIELTVGETASEPATRTAESRDPTVVANVGEDLRAGDWRKAALSRGYQSVASVPLVYDDVSFGVLTVYASRPDVFDEMTRTVLYELGETIASAIRSVERKTAFMSNSITELEYRIADSQCALYTLAQAAGCTVTLKGGAHPASDGTQTMVSIDDGSADAVIQAAQDMVAIDEIRPVVRSETDTLLKVRITTPFIGTELSNHGAVLQSFTATPTGASMTVDVPQTIDTHEINDLVTGRYPDSEIVAQRDRNRSLMTEQQFRAEFLETITERQLEVVQTAYFSGYFDSPRRNSGEDVAETLDISSAAFYNHIRNVQKKLFSTLFDQTEPLTIARG